MTDENYLPISLVAHTAFCERRLWLEVNGEKSDLSQMQAGFSAHKMVDNPASSRAGKCTSVPLRSETLRIIGKADELDLISEDEVIIVDYKATPVRRTAQVTPANRLQLMLQKLCLEESGKTVIGQQIYFTDHHRRVEVELTREDREIALKAVGRTHEIVESRTSPPPLINDERCAKCSHFSICLPDESQLRTVKRRIHVADPDGQVLHLTVQGSRASIRSGRVEVKKGDETLGSIPMSKINGLVVHGNIDISSALNRSLFWNNIPIVFCSSTGRVYGFSRSADSPNGLSRVRQHVVSANGSLPIARAIIHAKIHNQATVLRRNGNSPSAVANLRSIEKRVFEAGSIPELFGIEGEAASVYFDAIGTVFKSHRMETLGWSWSHRAGRSATDPVNVLLNYSYGLLRVECIRAILSCGLDPHAGFLHSSNRNKPALALDLMEEFRAPIADSVVMSLINRGEIRDSDFSFVGGAARLRDSGRKALISGFERRIQTSIRHPIFGYEATWRRTIEIQARLILGVLDGSVEKYEGVKVR